MFRRVCRCAWWPNQVSRWVSTAQSTLVGDPGLRNLQQGQIIQLERRGYFRVDKVFLSSAKPLTLITVPDGKQKSMSTLSTKLSHR